MPLFGSTVDLIDPPHGRSKTRTVCYASDIDRSTLVVGRCGSRGGALGDGVDFATAFPHKSQLTRLFEVEDRVLVVLPGGLRLLISLYNYDEYFDISNARCKRSRPTSEYYVVVDVAP